MSFLLLLIFQSLQPAEEVQITIAPISKITAIHPPMTLLGHVSWQWTNVQLEYVNWGKLKKIDKK